MFTSKTKTSYFKNNACPGQISLEYFSVVWDPFRQIDIDKLETIQTSTARLVTQNYRQTAV